MNCVVVPWFSCKEWEFVNTLIYGQPMDRPQAIQRLLVWKARCPSLPSGIESTLTLLTVMHQDEHTQREVMNQNVLRLAYSSAIIRFVNHMLDGHYTKGIKGNLYSVAHELGVPEWIIDMRHETAHGTNLPTLELFRSAAMFALKWLETEYWGKQKEVLVDCRVGVNVPVEEDEEKVVSMFEFYITLSVCINSANIKNLSDISETNELREPLILKIQELFGDTIDVSNPESVPLAALLKLANQKFKKYVKYNNCGPIVAKTLVNEQSLFMSLELINVLAKDDFNRDALGERFIHCFEILLIFLHSTDLLSDLILELLKVTRQTEMSNNYRKLSALWLSQIFKALNKSRLFLEKGCFKNYNENPKNTKLNIKMQFKHNFPNMMRGLFLNLQKGVPKEFTQLSYVQPIICAYNPFLTYFIKDLLCLLKPSLPEANVNKICHLTKLIASKSTTKSVPFKVFTVMDLQNESNAVIKTDSDVEILDNSDEEGMDAQVADNNGENSTWKLAPNNHNWAACPLGLLPWQIITLVPEQ